MDQIHKRRLSSLLASTLLLSTLPIPSFAALQQSDQVDAETAKPLTEQAVPTSDTLVRSEENKAPYDTAAQEAASLPDAITLSQAKESEVTVFANELTYQNLRYMIGDNGEVTITKCDDTVTSIDIPAQIDGKPVTSIGDEAFMHCVSLTSVTIPDSVTSIGNSAFFNCTSLTGVSIPDGVTSIGDEAFRHCASLTSVTISDSVTSIGYWTFHNCTSLTNITIPNSVTSIDNYAFAYCTRLTSVTIPDSITSIGDEAFSGCSSLTDAYYSGSQDQWNDIAVGYGNDALTAVLRYDSAGPAPGTALDYTITAITPQNGSVQVAISGVSSKDGRLVVAVYTDKGQLLTTSIKNVTAAELAAGAVDMAMDTSGAAYVSAFLLENNSNSKPLASKKLQQL